MVDHHRHGDVDDGRLDRLLRVEGLSEGELRIAALELPLWLSEVVVRDRRLREARLLTLALAFAGPKPPGDLVVHPHDLADHPPVLALELPHYVLIAADVLVDALDAF